MPGLSVDQVLSAEELGVSAGFADLLETTVGGRRVLYALNRAEGMLHEFSVEEDGTLVFQSSLVLSGAFAVGSEPMLTAVKLGGNSALAISGLDPTTGAYVSLSATGALGAQFAEPAYGQLSATQTFSLGTSTALITGRSGGWVDLYVDDGSGPSFVGGVADDIDRYLADSQGGLTPIEGPTPFVAVASAAESGVSVLRVELDGAMSLASSFGAAEGLPINTPSEMATLENGSDNRLVIASTGSSSLTVLRIDETGELWLEDHVLDSPATRFQSATTVEATFVGDHAFVAAGGADGGVSLFTMLPNGRLIHLDTIVDTGATTLYRVSSLALSVSPSTLNLTVASQWELGITRLGYDISALGAVLILDDGDAGLGTAGQDQIIGTDISDTLAGGDDNDILFDGAGADVMTGGSGADLFVFAADGALDRVEDFESGVDRLDLSAFDFLYDVVQLSVTPTSNGARIAFSDEVIELFSADGRPLSAADFRNADILNVDRPPVLEINQTLTGGPLADHLNGGPGADSISGGDGDDWLSGAGGADQLFGGNGNDSLGGGGGDDVLEGNGGADTAAGGQGDDLIKGGGGADVLYGDDFDWVDPA